MITITIPTDPEIWIGILTAVTAAWTFYQEHRHKKNHGTIKHRKQEIDQEKQLLERLKQKL